MVKWWSRRSKYSRGWLFQYPPTPPALQSNGVGKATYIQYQKGECGKFQQDKPLCIEEKSRKKEKKKARSIAIRIPPTGVGT